MAQKRIAIIGGGIAGLCAAVYARKCGYAEDVYEMGHVPGGLAMSWRRGQYTFETCLHWLLGSNPHRNMYARWQEVFDIGKLQFVDQEEYARVETEDGRSLVLYTNVDRMEEEFLRAAPQDAAEIRKLASAVRRLTKLPVPDPDDPLTLVPMLPALPLLRRMSRTSIRDYARRYTHPMLRKLLGDGEMAELSMTALLFSLAWMSDQNAGYAIGGSQAIIRGIVENLRKLGGNLRLGARVEKIMVENDTAIGVQLAGGERIPADWVISAADGHATVYEMLSGKYTDQARATAFQTLKSFPSYVQVSLGVARDLSGQPALVSVLLDAPIALDPGTELSEASFRFFHFDPTFAPPGKTAVTCFLPTRNFEYWTDLEKGDPARYRAEKHRVAEAVIEVLERRLPGVREAIEVWDVSTPATVIRFTGNWKGSMEGWLLTPESGLRPLSQELPGLRRFRMIGQWVMPGGGLPSGLITARSAMRAICKQDRVKFMPGDEPRRRAA
jgi:phytoene dehydrogenase-like protein